VLSIQISISNINVSDTKYQLIFELLYLLWIYMELQIIAVSVIRILPSNTGYVFIRYWSILWIQHQFQYMNLIVT